MNEDASHQDGQSTTEAPLERTASADVVFLSLAPQLRRIAVRRFALQPADADDLVSAVFTSYLVNREHVRGDPKPYLIGAIFNASRKFTQRRRALADRFDSRNEAVEAASVDDRTFDRLATNVLVAATIRELKATNSRCAEALCRAYMRGESTDEIATGMNTSRTNVNYLLHICRKKAREIYVRLVRRSNG